MDVLERIDSLLESKQNSRVEVRDSGEVTYKPTGFLPDEIVGAMMLQSKAVVIVKLDKHQVDWLKGLKVPTKHVFRGVNMNNSGAENIVKLNLQTGTFAFVDNEHLLATDQVKFQTARKFTKLFIDGTPNAQKAFSG